MQSPEEIEHYVEGVKVLAEQFNQSVLAMVRGAAERVSPAETLGNRRRRRDARRRLGERYQPPRDGGISGALQPTDQSQAQ